jgi:hypothetical protein
MQEGQGISFNWQEKSIYEGCYKKGVKNGEGILQKCNGEKIWQLWDMGKLCH